MARSSTVGRVLTEAIVENLQDLWDLQRGLRPPQDARRVTVTDALVPRCTACRDQWEQACPYSGWSLRGNSWRPSSANRARNRSVVW
jgi:hypothetical protein